MLRRSLPETFHAPARGERERTPLRPYLWIAAIGLMLLANGTIGAYTTDYMTTYAIATLHMRANVAFAATIVVGLSGVVFDLVSGALSDRIGRKPMMLVPGVLLLVSILPAFYVISHYRTTATLLGATAMLSSLTELSACPVIIWLTESFPARIRSGSIAIIYAFSIALFGGTTARKLGVDPGGDIMIHGVTNGLGWLGSMHRVIDWTDGCIAVTDAEMDEIWSLVPDGTPIEIRP